MAPRARYLNALQFRPVDRIPMMEWGIREATLRAWVKQGYPPENDQKGYFDLDTWQTGVGINTGMNPPFEERVLEETGEYKIWIDPLGAKRKDFKVLPTPGFVTRSWLEFAVKDRADFLEMKKRYIAAEPSRYADNWKEHAARTHASDQPVHLGIPFLFWVVRDWVGFENLCMMFYDNPKLIHEMFEFVTDFVIDTLKGRIDDLAVDVAEFKEDMAYKGAPMISPEMFRKFMFPHYVRTIEFLKGHGVKIVYVDCDGYPGELIPCWLDAGIDAVSPCEIAAGNDMLGLREAYPALALYGGIDKRPLARDRAAIYEEVMGKVPAMLEKGGYIPHIDHAIPPDAKLDVYRYYREILVAVAEGRTPPQP